MKTAILGAGVSGLALARQLLEGGLSRSDLHLFESGQVIGGLCRSKTVDGFTYDIAGGHILYSKDAHAMRWMKDCAGGERAFVERDRRTKIRFKDRWVKYPFENGLGDLPVEANYDCLKGYVQAWHERQLHRTPAPADFGAWIRWRFGEGIARHFMDPYNEKVWKRALSDITSGWVAGRVPEAPVDDVLKAAVGLETEGYTHQAIFFYPLRGGFQAITDGIGAAVLDRVRLSTPVTELARRGESWCVNGEPFDCVVSTLPLTVLPEIVEGIPDDVARCMRELDYNSLVCFLLALDRADHPDFSWVYLPHPEQGPANRITYMSNYSPRNAPEGKSSFLCEVTWPRGEARPGEELAVAVISGMVRAGLLRREEILFVDRSEVEHAYVVFDHGYEERRRRSLAWLEEADILPLGRFGRFDYDNSDQSVIKARELAPRLLERARSGGKQSVNL